VIFPSSDRVDGFSQQTSLPLTTHPEVGRVWIVGCIVYHDAEHQTHHTKFWLRSSHPDNSQWIVVNNGEFRYMPITGFESWGEEAD
jgi:hypothetical protein